MTFASLMTPVLLSDTASGIEGVMNNGMTIGERLVYGLEMTAVGLLTVFAVLGVIWLTMMLFRLVFYTIPNRRQAKAETVSVPLPEEIPAPVPEESAPQEPAPAADDALLAVLSAAVAAVLADEAAAAGNSAPGFRVVSFRRTGRSWNSRT